MSDHSCAAVVLVRTEVFSVFSRREVAPPTVPKVVLKSTRELFDALELDSEKAKQISLDERRRISGVTWSLAQSAIESLPKREVKHQSSPRLPEYLCCW